MSKRLNETYAPFVPESLTKLLHKNNGKVRSDELASVLGKKLMTVFHKKMAMSLCHKKQKEVPDLKTANKLLDSVNIIITTEVKVASGNRTDTVLYYWLTPEAITQVALGYDTRVREVVSKALTMYREGMKMIASKECTTIEDAKKIANVTLSAEDKLWKEGYTDLTDTIQTAVDANVVKGELNHAIMNFQSLIRFIVTGEKTKRGSKGKKVKNKNAREFVYNGKDPVQLQKYNETVTRIKLLLEMGNSYEVIKGILYQKEGIK